MSIQKELHELDLKKAMNKPYVIEKVRKDGVSVGHLRSSTGDWFSFNLRRMAERLADLTERNDPEHYYIVKKI